MPLNPYDRRGQVRSFGGMTKRNLGVKGYAMPYGPSSSMAGGLSRRVSPPTRAGTGGGFGGRTAGVDARGRGGVGGGGIGGGATPPTMPYEAGGGPGAGLAGTLGEVGKGLVDPKSNYSRRLRSEVSRDIGEQAGARKRMAALRAARAGLGSGASAELLDTQGEIDREGLEAAGEAGSELMLQGPALGERFLRAGMQGELGLRGQDLTGFLQQQAHNLARSGKQADIDLELERLNRDSMMRELALLYGGGF